MNRRDKRSVKVIHCCWRKFFHVDQPDDGMFKELQMVQGQTTSGRNPATQSGRPDELPKAKHRVLVLRKGGAVGPQILLEEFAVQIQHGQNRFGRHDNDLFREEIERLKFHNNTFPTGTFEADLQADPTTSSNNRTFHISPKLQLEVHGKMEVNLD
jgi:hypothetical protein